MTIPLIQMVPQNEKDFIVDHVEVKEFIVGQAIVKEGEPGTACFIIREGSAKVVKEVGVGNPVHIVTLKEGHIFGELALLTDEPRVASVIAETPTICLALSKEVFTLAETHAPIFCQVLTQIAEQRQAVRANRQRSHSLTLAKNISSSSSGTGTSATNSSFLSVDSGSSSMKQSFSSDVGAFNVDHDDSLLTINNLSINTSTEAGSTRSGEVTRGLTKSPSKRFLVSDEKMLDGLTRSSTLNSRQSTVDETIIDQMMHQHSAATLDHQHSFNSSFSGHVSSGNEMDSGSETDDDAIKFTSTVTMKKLSSGTRIINKYVIVNQIGKGSYGEVFLCRDEETSELYAMKVIHRGSQNLAANDPVMEAVRREIALFKKLRHPNIVR